MNEKTAYKYYSGVEAQEVEWLWYPYIPYGKITLLQGDPGEGKSTFAVNLAAVLTTGGNLPDNHKITDPVTVIYQCAEDSIEDTIKPRLLQAGANCERVAFICEGERNITLDDSRLEETIQATHARLLILDPIQAFLPQDWDMQNAVRMRSILRKLAEVAAQYRCAVILVSHMNKSSSGKNLYRSLGSIDIAAIARSVLMIARDEKNPEVRYMFPVKSSLAPEGESIAFLFNKDSGFHWIGKCKMEADAVAVHTPSTLCKKDRAVQLLRIMLSSGDVASVDVFNRMDKLGISKRTVQTAGKELGINAYRKNNAWFWSLTPEENEDE